MGAQGPLLRTRRAAVSSRQRINYIRMGMVILSLASFLLTMLYLDFTDSEMANPAQEPADNMQPQSSNVYQLDQEEDLQDEREESDAAGDPDIDTASGTRPPEVLNIQPFHAPARGGLELTIHGHHFMGFGDWTTTAMVDGRECTSTEVLNFDTLICNLPAGVGAGLNVGVRKTVEGKALYSSANTLFSYDAPLVEHVSPDHCATEGGVEVTVHGTNFGVVSEDASQMSLLQVKIGDALCSGVDLKSDSELTCTVPPGSGGATTVQVIVGSGQHVVESHRSRNQFTYILSPREKIKRDSGILLDGLHLKHASIPVVMHKASLTGLNEFLHKDLFTGRTIAFSGTPELISLLPEHDLRDHHETCSVVLNSAHLLDTSYGADIDCAEAVFRFNDSPSEGFKSEVGGKTTYRFVQLPLMRTMLSKITSQGGSKWHPQNSEKLIMMSEYAQDLFVQLHRALPGTELLIPSAALMGNIGTLYDELRRRLIDLGIDQELPMRIDAPPASRNGKVETDAVQGDDGGRDVEYSTDQKRSLLGADAAVSMARLASWSQHRLGLAEVEPATGQSRPSQVLSAIILAIQMCKQVTLFGYDSIFSNADFSPENALLTYYSKTPVAYTVHDISSTVEPSIRWESRNIENAIVELLQQVGHLQLQH